jgi:hypothetical protein
MAILVKSTAYNRMFLMVESADHITGLTGATVTLTLSKNGGSFGASSGSITEVSSGWYYVALNSTDTGTAGELAYHATATSADPADFVDQVRDPAVATYGVNLVNILGTVAATPATAGILDVNVKNMNNVAATSITTINANQGTTQPLNFTGTAGSALVKADTIDFGSTAVTGRDIGASVLLSVGTGTGQVNLSSGNVPITSNIKKNAASRIGFTMTDSTTHAPKTGLTVASTVSIDGGAFGATVNSVTEISSGDYTLVLAAGDTNGNDLIFRFTASGADDLNIEVTTQP